MRASTPTKLPLWRWFQLVGVNPLHGAGLQLDGSSGLPNTQNVSCGQAWAQHSWQASDAVSREDVAEAIAEAEGDLERYIGYRLLPTWEFDEWAHIERYFRPEAVMRPSFDVRGLHNIVKARWGHILTGGIKAATVLEEGSAITWSDEDGDSYDETGTVTVASGSLVVDAAEVHAFYPGKDGAPEWEIRPIHVVIASGVSTITFRRELAVLEDLQEALGWEAQDASVDASFLAEVDVYRIYNDPQTQVSFLWEPAGGCSCSESGSCVQCSYETQTGCLLMRDRALGVLSYAPGDWNATDEDFDRAEWIVGRMPDVARLYYRAGWQDQKRQHPTIEMDRDWERVIARFAAAKLDRPGCVCAAGMNRWQTDLAFRSGGEEFSAYNVSAQDLDNPFGTRRGAIAAWRRVRDPETAIVRSAVMP